MSDTDTCDFEYYINYFCITKDDDYDISLLSIIIGIGAVIQGVICILLAKLERKKLIEMKNFEWGSKTDLKKLCKENTFYSFIEMTLIKLILLSIFIQTIGSIVSYFSLQSFSDTFFKF